MTKPKYHPILFNTAMVQAILSGTKSQTRRTKGLEEINEKPDMFRYDSIEDDPGAYCGDHFFEHLHPNGLPKEIYYPVENKYQVGDVFWVRETSLWVMDEHAPDLLVGYKEKTQFVYKASTHTDWMVYYARKVYGYKWTPSIFMPKIACRIFLKIKSIRAEQLNYISEADAIAEGVKYAKDKGKYVFFDSKKSYEFDGNKVTNNPKEAFEFLWKKINGNDSWNKNPWVWVYEFERIEKPIDFI